MFIDQIERTIIDEIVKMDVQIRNAQFICEHLLTHNDSPDTKRNITTELRIICEKMGDSKDISPPDTPDPDLLRTQEEFMSFINKLINKFSVSCTLELNADGAIKMLNRIYIPDLKGEKEKLAEKLIQLGYRYNPEQIATESELKFQSSL